MTKARCALIGAVYFAVSVMILVVTASVDPFSLFDRSYFLLNFIALPLVPIAFTLYSIYKIGQLGRMRHALLAAWIMLVTMGHMWLVAQFAAGV